MMLIYVLLCIICVILVALVLMQDSKSGLGGLTGGTTMSAFGANTDKALVKATGIMGTLFFVLVIVIHLVKKEDAKSLLPESSKPAPTKVVAPSINLDDKKGTTVKDLAPATPNKTEAEPEGTSVTIPLKDAKDAPAKEEKKETPPPAEAK